MVLCGLLFSLFRAGHRKGGTKHFHVLRKVVVINFKIFFISDKFQICA